MWGSLILAVVTVVTTVWHAYRNAIPGPPGPEGSPGEPGEPFSIDVSQDLGDCNDFASIALQFSDQRGAKTLTWLVSSDTRLDSVGCPTVTDLHNQDVTENDLSAHLLAFNGQSWKDYGPFLAVAGQDGQDGQDGKNGIDGKDGTDGKDGRTIWNGSGAPDDSLGQDGDFYLDTVAYVLFGPKALGTWSGSASIELVGTDGTDGHTILNGTGIPSNGLGVDGDFYMDTDEYVLYGPKSGGQWPIPGIYLTSSLGSIGSSPNAAGATLTSGVLALQPASASFGGVMTTGDQSFSGIKTFTNRVIVSDTTNAIDSTTGSVHTDGGLSAAKDVFVGGDIVVDGDVTADGTIDAAVLSSTDLNVSGNVTSDLTLAANHNFEQKGSGTLTTGTGAVSLNGNVQVANGKTFAQGTATSGTDETYALVSSMLFVEPSPNVGGFTIQGDVLYTASSSTSNLSRIRMYQMRNGSVVVNTFTGGLISAATGWVSIFGATFPPSVIGGILVTGGSAYCIFDIVTGHLHVVPSVTFSNTSDYTIYYTVNAYISEDPNEIYTDIAVSGEYILTTTSVASAVDVFFIQRADDTSGPKLLLKVASMTVNDFPPERIIVSGTTAHVYGPYGYPILGMMDITNPRAPVWATPTVVSNIGTGVTIIYDVLADDGVIYVATDGSAQLFMYLDIDLTNPISRLSLSGGATALLRIAMHATYIYGLADQAGANQLLTVIEATQLQRPILQTQSLFYEVKTIDLETFTPGTTGDVKVIDTRLFVASYDTSRLYVFNITNPAAPVKVSNISGLTDTGVLTYRTLTFQPNRLVTYDRFIHILGSSTGIATYQSGGLQSLAGHFGMVTTDRLCATSTSAFKDVIVDGTTVMRGDVIASDILARNNIIAEGTVDATTLSTTDLSVSGNVTSDLTLAANHNFEQKGSGTFTTGTGAVSLNGNVQVGNGKTFAHGTSTSALDETYAIVSSMLFIEPSPIVSGFTIQGDVLYTASSSTSNLSRIRMYKIQNGSVVVNTFTGGSITVSGGGAGVAGATFPAAVVGGIIVSGSTVCWIADFVLGTLIVLPASATISTTSNYTIYYTLNAYVSEDPSEVYSDIVAFGDYVHTTTQAGTDVHTFQIQRLGIPLSGPCLLVKIAIHTFTMTVDRIVLSGSGVTAYVWGDAGGYSTISSVDISNPRSPSSLADTQVVDPATNGYNNIFDVLADDDVVYIATDGSAQLHLYSAGAYITNNRICFFSLSGAAPVELRRIVMHTKYIYGLAIRSGTTQFLTVIETTQLYRPYYPEDSIFYEVTSINLDTVTSGTIGDLKVVDTRLFVASYDASRLYVFNITNPAAPVKLTNLSGLTDTGLLTYRSLTFHPYRLVTYDRFVHILGSSTGIVTYQSGGLHALAGNFGMVTADRLRVTSASTLKDIVVDGTASVSGKVVLDGDVTVANNLFIAGGDLAMDPIGAGSFQTGRGWVFLNGPVSVGQNAHLIMDSSGTGQFTTGTGAVALNGNVTVAANKSVSMASGTGTFTTGTGAVTLNGPVTVASGQLLTLNGNLTQSGTGAVTTGSGAVTLNGDVTVAANKNVLMTSGTGTFTTGTGAVTLNGTVTVSANKDLIMGTVGTPGAGAFQTGTGAVSLNGPVTVAANQDLKMTSGTGAFQTGTGAVSLNGAVTVVANQNLRMGTVGTPGSGAFSTGTGAVTLNGPVTVATNQDLKMASGSTGAFQTGTGAVSLNGDVTVALGKLLTLNGNLTQSSTGTVTTGSGAVALNGDVTVASGKLLTLNGNVTQSGTGALTTGSGAVTLNGNVTINSNKTFTSGTGDVTLQGNVFVTANNSFTQSGTGSFSTGTGGVSLRADVNLTTGKYYDDYGVQLFLARELGRMTKGMGSLMLLRRLLFPLEMLHCMDH
jgi:hypothetical protein